MALELEVYGVEDPFTKKDIIPFRWEPSILEELRGPGAGSFNVRPEDADDPDNAGLYAWRNIIKVRNTETKKCLGGFLIQSRSEVMVTREEESGRYIQFSGEGLRTWFHDATVYPMGGLNQYAADSRVFSFASEQGAWYNPAQWTSPVNLWKVQAAGNRWGTAPANWPDEPNAYWVWDRSTATIETFPVGTVYFRREFTLAANTSCSLFIAVDNTYNVYIDAQNVGSFPQADVSNFQQTNRIDFTLGPGNHVLAIEATNTGGPAGVLAALRSNGDPNAPATVATTIFKTGDAGWKMLAYPTTVPGWTTGMILLKLLAEAEARGVAFPAILQPTFTDTLDSAGEPWADAQAWEFDVGAEYTTVIDKIEELNADIWIDAETYELHAKKRRGSDKSMDSGQTDRVALIIGKNITEGSVEGDADMKNALLLKTADGWFEKQSNGTGSTTYGRMEAQAATDAGKSFSDTVASFIFEQHDQPVTTVSYSFLPDDEVEPWKTVFVGDYVLAPDADRTMNKQRVSSLSATEDTAGNPVYAAEFGTIIKDKIDRLEKRLDNLSNGASPSVQGTSSNVTVPSGGVGSGGKSFIAQGSSSGGGGSGTLATPATPTNLLGDAQGYFAPDGTPKSRLRLRWSAVTQDTSGSALTVDHYDVWAKRNRTLAERTITNLHTNPNFESSVSDVAGFNATATQSTNWSLFGTRSLKITPNSSSISSYAALGGGAGGLRSGLAAGNWYNVSAYLRLSATQAGTLEKNARSLAVIYRDVNGNLQTAVSQPIPNVANQVSRASLTVYIPAGATEAWIQVVNGTSTANTVDLYVDAVQVTLGNALYPYIDGSLTSDAMRTYAWTGTANASTSTLVIADQTILVGSVVGNAVDLENLDPGSAWTFSVSAVQGIDGANTAGLNLTLPFPDTQLGVPTDPTVTSAFGLVAVHWDGNLAGAAPDLTFDSVYAAMGSYIGDTFVPVGQALNKAGDIIVPNLVAGDQKYFQLIAVDKAGNLSGASQPIAVTITAGAGGSLTSPPLPVGAITPYAGASAPAGFLMADGSAVSRTQYSDLFSVIGTTYGAGDGSTTFNLPNMKGSIPVGLDTSQTEFNALGKVGGSKTNTHNHFVGLANDGSGMFVTQTAQLPRSRVVTKPRLQPFSGASSNTTTREDSTYDETISVLSPYVTVNYVIRYVVGQDTGGTSGRISYATIEPYYSNGKPMVTFDGDTGLSGPYPWLPPYIPVAGDRVALAKDPGGSYLILGKQQTQASFSNRIYLPVNSDWRAYSGDWNPFSISKSEHGLVTMEGLINKGPSSNTWTPGEVIATLPPGFRPDYDIIRSIYAYQGSTTDAARELIIRTNGDVILGPSMSGGLSGNFLSLSGVYFFAAGYADWKVVGVDSGYAYGSNISAYTDGSGLNYGPLRIYQEPTSGIVWVDGVVQKNSGNFASNDTLVSFPTALAADFQYIFPCAAGPNGNLIAEYRVNKSTSGASIFYPPLGLAFSQRLPLHAWWRPAAGNALAFANLTGANSWVNYDNGVTYCPVSYARMGSVTLMRGLMKSGTVPATMTPVLNAPGLSIPNSGGSAQGALHLGIAADNIARYDHRPVGNGALAAIIGSNAWFALDGIAFSPTS